MGEALLLAGMAGSAGAQIGQGIAASNRAETQAEIAERNAQARRQQAESEAARMRVQHRRQRGRTRAAFGASGVRLEGTPIEVLADQAATQQTERDLVRFGGESDARSRELQADVFRQRGRDQLVGSAIGAGGTLLTGASTGNQRFGWFSGGDTMTAGGGLSTSGRLVGSGTPTRATVGRMA